MVKLEKIGVRVTIQVRINSYFSLPTDLAHEMKDWPEFINGEGYSVDLKDLSTEEEVAVRLVDGEPDVPTYVVIKTNRSGPLFDRVVGRAVFALSAHSDNIMLMRWK